MVVFRCCRHKNNLHHAAGVVKLPLLLLYTYFQVTSARFLVATTTTIPTTFITPTPPLWCKKKKKNAATVTLCAINSSSGSTDTATANITPRSDAYTSKGGETITATTRREWITFGTAAVVSSAALLGPCHLQPANAAAATATAVASTTKKSAVSPSATIENTSNNNIAVGLSGDGGTFRTAGFERPEYTNSITASKDTNISPKEAYDTLSNTIKEYVNPNVIMPKQQPQTKSTNNKSKSSNSGTGNNNNVFEGPWALDVGAGAGVSTQLIYDLGFQYHIDAVDWSGLAWEKNVLECPSSVTFYEMDDESFFEDILQKRLLPTAATTVAAKTGATTTNVYDLIIYNFAINPAKASAVAKKYLSKEKKGILLAPVNATPDYWYKQTYYIINASGETIWKSPPDVGAWSVQFQPDVTSDTCQGIWCPPYNGFIKRKKR